MLNALLSSKKTATFSLRDIASILQSSAKFGLRINDLEKITAELNKNTEKVTIIALSRCIYGLKSIEKNSQQDFLPLIAALTSKVRASRDRLDAQGIGNMLYGLQNLRSETREVLLLVSALVGGIQLCQELLSAQEVGNALYGLQNMSSNEKEVLQLLSVLASKVQSCQEPLSAQAVGNALYGLQNMSSN